MQPGVTVVLATVWLYANVVGTASLNSSRFSLDQYSPLAPQHELYQRVPIGSRRSSSTSTASPLQSFKSNYLEKDSLDSRSKGNSGDEDDDFSPLVEDKRRRKEFTERKIDEGGTKDSMRPSLARSELEDPFVADDTFQDQGPGSMEIYKLDLLRLSPLSHAPLTRYLLKGKGKTPKKTSQTDWKTKTDYKTTSPKMFYKQSNSFDDLSTEVPPNSDPFSIGGVPELQVGCEGLAASRYKQKRSIDSGSRDKAPVAAMDAWPGVTPISLDLEYDFSSVEEEEEEMDELVRLKKLETTTKGIKQNRGDMEATRYSDTDDKRRPEKLPVRGDLGKSNGQNSTGGDQKTAGEGSNSDIAKREAKSADSLVTAHQRRRILWLADEQLRAEGRSKRQIWGFGEDEGVVSSDELQTENQRRRQDYERRRKEEERRRLEEARRRGHVENRTNSEVERIRQEYERSLQERTRQEEERQRRLQQEARRTSSRWQPPEEQRPGPQELDASPGRYESYPRTYEEERRRQEAEAMRRRDSEAERRRQQELDRRHLEQRRREWMLKRRQEEEEERRRQLARNEPSNLLYAMRAASNETGPYYVDPERRLREQQERERAEKLKEYMQRNRPINPADRQREEEVRRRQEEERRVQEYIRRNQPVHVTSWNGSSVDERRKMDDGPRLYNWSRYPGQDNGRRNHGPSAPTNIDPRSFVDEGRRKEASRRTEEERIRERERLEEEQLRKEALRREEETRRLQSRRYEEQRKRLEAARRDADRRRKELMEEQARRSQAGRTRSENTRHGYDDRARLDEQRRRQDTSLIPANLVLNESRRAMELERLRQEQERQRHEQERWRLEAERRRQEDSRASQAREHEQRRRQEEARLNALPVSAKIIVHPAESSSSPRLSSRTGFDGDIDFPGVNPYRRGVEVPNFPAAATRRPPVQSPPPCVWAVVQCCPFKTNRLVTCFESMGCPGVNWDPNPCRATITQAARQQITKFYAESEEENRGL